MKNAEGNRAIDPDLVEAGNIAGIHGVHDHNAESRYNESGGAAEEAEENALRQHLPRQAVPACSEGGADGDFLFASRGTGEQKICHVGTGD